MLTKEELKVIPKDYFRVVLKNKQIISIFTDDGANGGKFWDIKLCKK